MSTTTGHTEGPSRLRFAIAFAVIYAAHLALVAYALPLSDVLGDRPYASPDYQTHFRQTTVLTRVADRFGKLWGYDPGLLAGQAIGLIFDVDNKLHFLFSYGLHKAGLKLSAAYNLFTLVSCLLAPLSVWLAGRLFRVGRRPELVTLALAVLVWHFDSGSAAWRGGMISFTTVSHGALVVLALFFRMTEPAAPRRWRFFLPLLLLLPLNLLTHVWTFTILVVPMGALYVRHSRTLARGGHAMVWALVVASLAGNAHWLLPALQHADVIATSGVVGQANPLYIFSDWFGILVDPLNTGFALPHTLFRFAAICCAAITLWRWRRERDGRLFVATLSLLWLFGLAYGASFLPLLRETEPYRFVFPASLLCCVLGSPYLAGLLSRDFVRELPGPARVLVLVLLILLTPRLVEHVVYFVPELSPQAKLPPIVVDRTAAAPTSTLPRQWRDPEWLARSWRLRRVDDPTMALARFVQQKCRDEGRLLVQHWAVAEFLGWATDRPIIGGFPDRRMVFESANIFRRPTDPRFWGRELAAYLERYNVRYVVMTDPVAEIERRLDLITPYKLLLPHRIYRVLKPSRYVALGVGRVHADLNRIEVRDAVPAPGSEALLLRFHYMDTLRCRPECFLDESPIPHSRVGFIRVVGKPRLPRQFVIEHDYR